MDDYGFEELTEEHYAIAEENGISRHNVWQRYEVYMWDLKDAITKPVRKVRRDYQYCEEAIQRAEEIGVSRELYQKRIRIGWDAEKAATTPVMTKEEMGVESGKKKGKFTDEQVATFTKNGIPRPTVRQRLLKGWSMEEAITHSVLKTGQRREGIEHTSNRSFGQPFVR